MPDQVMAEVTAELTRLSALVDNYRQPERARLDGLRPDLPGRGRPLMPPYVIDEQLQQKVAGSINFDRFYLGGNGAVHGGALPLMFDDLLGAVANHLQPGIARTAFIHVNYRRITPIDTDLRFECTLDRVQGRKRWTSGRLTDSTGLLLVDAEGMFLELLPGQR